MSNPTALTNDSLTKMAPSIFAPAPHHRVSAKYSFLPTSHVVDLLSKHGWLPVRAMQTAVRKMDRQGFQRHMIRFRHQSEIAMNVGDSIPELVLVNSHDSTASYQLQAGLFRLVCANGLVIADSLFAKIAVRHVGFKADDVIEASYRVLNDLPKITASVEEMRGLQLTEDERCAFSDAALRIKYPENSPIEARQLLTPRRQADRDPNLWTTFNCVQENLIRGGLAGRSASLRRVQTRPVKGIAEDLKLNKSLWSLAEDFKARRTDCLIVKAA